MSELRLDQKRLVSELTASWLQGLTGASLDEGQRLLRELVVDWAREADGDAECAETNRFQQEALSKAGAGKDATGRLDALRVVLLERQVRTLAARTFTLAKGVVDGAAHGDDPAAQGRALLQQAEALAAQVQKVQDANAAARLQRDLGEATMDALYVVERKAMSSRLQRYVETKS